MKKTSLLLLTVVSNIFLISNSSMATEQNKEKPAYNPCKTYQDMMHTACKASQVPIPLNGGTIVLKGACLTAQNEYQKCMRVHTKTKQSFPIPKTKISNPSTETTAPSKEDN